MIFFRIKNTNKKVLEDFILSFFASFVTIAVTQLMLLPILAKIFDSEQYGNLLNIIGITNSIAGAIGGSLDNTRLVVEDSYEKDEKREDFWALWLIEIIVGIMILVVCLILKGENNILLITGISILVLCMSARNYGGVTYRLKINYKKILILSVTVAIGNIVGVLIVHYSRNYKIWFIPFLIGEVLGLLFLVLKSEIFKEGCKFTSKIKDILKVELPILFTSILANLILYLDRLLLYPVLGGAAVSIYSTASFFGKTFGVVMIPFAGVLLSYYSQKNFKMNRKKFWEINIIMLIIALAFFTFCILGARFFTGVLYPTLVQYAIPYLLFANMAAIINTTANMTQPAVLKFAPKQWMVVVQLGYTIIYICLGIIAAKKYGLKGFSVAAVFASLFRLIMLYIIGDCFCRKDVDF